MKRSLVTICILSFFYSLAIDRYDEDSDSRTLSMSEENSDDTLTEIENNTIQNALPSLKDLHNDMSMLDFQLPASLLPVQLPSITDIHKTSSLQFTLPNRFQDTPFANRISNISFPNSLQSINLPKKSIEQTLPRKSITEKKPFMAETERKLHFNPEPVQGAFFKLLHQFGKAMKQDMNSLPIPLPKIHDILSRQQIAMPKEGIKKTPIILNNTQLEQKLYKQIIKNSPNTIEKIYAKIGDQDVSFDGNAFIINEKRMWIKGGEKTIRAKILVNAMKNQPAPSEYTPKQICKNIQSLNRRLSGLNCAIEYNEKLSLVKRIIDQNQTKHCRLSHKDDLLSAVPNFQLNQIYHIGEHNVSINDNLQLCVDGQAYDIIDKKYAPKKMVLLAQLIASYPSGICFDNDNQKRKWRQWLQDQCFAMTGISVIIKENAIFLYVAK